MENASAASPSQSSSTGSGGGRRANGLVRSLCWLLVGCYFLFGLSFLLLRSVILPRIDDYRPHIVASLSRMIGLPIAIDGLALSWSGWRPRLYLNGVTVHDRQGRPALYLPRVDAMPAWSSLWDTQANFYRLEIVGPELTVRRHNDGRLFVAGLEIPYSTAGSRHARPLELSDNRFMDWLRDQHDILIRDAVLIWSDQQRDAPDLRLEQVDMRLMASAGQSDWLRFGIQARPPAELASHLDIRGEVRRRSPGGASPRYATLYTALDSGDLAAWRQWVDYPVELGGRGSVRLWADFHEGGQESLTSSVALSDVSVKLSDEAPVLRLDSANGSFGVRRSASEIGIRAQQLALSSQGIDIAPFNADLSLQRDAQGTGNAGSIRADSLDLSEWGKLAAYLPFDENIRTQLTQTALRGRIDELDMSWQGGWRQPQNWRLKAAFQALGANAYQRWPGFAEMSGEVEGSAAEGRYRLHCHDGSLDLPAVFPQPRVDVAKLQAEGGWRWQDDRVQVTLDKASFENQDAVGYASGMYATLPGDKRGEIDISGRLTRADALAVWRYMPWHVHEKVRDWLQAGIKGGASDDVRLRLRGALRDFPFENGEDGEFLVTVRVRDGELHYFDGWPDIDQIGGDLRFENEAMHFEASHGRMLGVDLNDVVGVIPDLSAPDGNVLSIQGHAAGPTRGFLRFLAESPVSEHIHGFAGQMKATGSGKLDLALTIPFRHAHETEVGGEFRFSDNRLQLFEALPAVEKASGRAAFTEASLTIPEIGGSFLGHPVTVSATTAGKVVTFTARGGANMEEVRQFYPFPALSHLNGSAFWQTEVSVGDTEGTFVLISSDLQGVASTLPAPFTKAAEERWPATAALRFSDGGTRQQIHVDLERAQLQLEARMAMDGWLIDRGALAVGAPLQLPERGLAINADLAELNVDQWREALDSLTQPVSPSTADSVGALSLAGVDVQAKAVKAFGQKLDLVEFTALADPDGWKGRIVSPQAQGVFDWRSAGKGTLRAHFSRLMIGGDVEGAPGAALSASLSKQTGENKAPDHLPALNIQADKFYLYDMDLGRLNLEARNQSGLWVLNRFDLDNEHAKLTGSGQWRMYGDPWTELLLDLETNDIGKLLDRIGYPRVVRGGHATLAGRIHWQGAPIRLDLPSLGGALTIEARNGQFRKLEPGVGRLLGVLSLQSLPRRLSLDFRDVFSEGFAFDTLSGIIDLASGVMHTDNLYIAGPAARVWIHGAANVVNETQALRVFVQPTLSESIALGAAAGLINPVAGVVTYLAQKALSDPIEKIFAFGYAVTGSWADPQVEKLLNSGSQPTGRAINGKRDGQ